MKDILGNHPQVKVIDYVLSCPFQEFTKQQLAVGSEISISALDRFIDDFLEYGLLIKSNSKYVVNFKSEFIKDFFSIKSKLVKLEIQKQESLVEEDYDELNDMEIDEFLSECTCCIR